jgi:formylglycine-generating enzyme required for sulfatase activity
MSWKIRVLACVFFLPLPVAAGFVPILPRPSDDNPVIIKLIVNSLGMKLTRIEPGTYQMGSPASEPGRNNNEILHEVDITQPFYMSAYETTQEEYEKVMGSNPSFFSRNGQGQNKAPPDTRRHPVENASWDDAKTFCARLTERERKAGKITPAMQYTLPTEAEWEYCCRASTRTAFAFGEQVSTDQANYNGQNMIVNGKPCINRDCTVPVGSFAPNAWGLYDMHGNVNEWCEDWYDTSYYPKSPRRDPPGAASGQIRVLRGGCWIYHPNNCRSALRDGIGANFRGNFCGFRVVLRMGPKS